MDGNALSDRVHQRLSRKSRRPLQPLFMDDGQTPSGSRTPQKCGGPLILGDFFQEALDLREFLGRNFDVLDLKRPTVVQYAIRHFDLAMVRPIGAVQLHGRRNPLQYETWREGNVEHIVLMCGFVELDGIFARLLLRKQAQHVGLVIAYDARPEQEQIPGSGCVLPRDELVSENEVLIVCLEIAQRRTGDHVIAQKSSQVALDYFQALSRLRVEELLAFIRRGTSPLQLFDLTGQIPGGA